MFWKGRHPRQKSISTKPESYDFNMIFILLSFLVSTKRRSGRLYMKLSADDGETTVVLPVF